MHWTLKVSYGYGSKESEWEENLYCLENSYSVQNNCLNLSVQFSSARLQGTGDVNRNRF